MSAGVLVGLVVLWQFILVPTLDNHRVAKAELDESRRTLSRLQETYMMQRLDSPQAQNTRGAAELPLDAFRSELTTSASAKGLQISRLQTSDASVTLRFERADPRLVFFWLEDVEARLGGAIVRLSMEQAGDGFVRASVDLEPR